MSAVNRSSELVVVGGGVIGLSIADEALRAGLSVTVLERGRCGREASWAGAGILPPRSWYVKDPLLDRLAKCSAELFPLWSARLLEETGIDNEYWHCGSTYPVRGASAAETRATLARWEQDGVVIEPHDEHFVHVPAEAQVRNPRHLRALIASVLRRGGKIVEGARVVGFQHQGDRLSAVCTTDGDYQGAACCLAAGCWTPHLAELTNGVAPGQPVRGQILLMRPRKAPPHIIHDPPWYLVPRRDGLVLVGATVENVGFARGVTTEARARLLAAAERMMPGLGSAPVEAFWSGLRPASADALPQIGRLPGYHNLLVAAGHHRSGLQFSPPTAKLIVAELTGANPPLSEEHIERLKPTRFAPAVRS
ncbi:NAD(P)/FAD-dependent oxidoreductase [Botrimarina hoheduenensis]|uniref:Hydrogen cyanide synthase subunit HcnC n=1 Tax=Botrimarina hoheduenensis TaxID=2528000 RepID=A0A5C5VTG9_9BACT|nr:FAD-dependent oxidoreductase [Botrimarina hoheduenensis]TWT41630.1 Hydrogen cyanide synthase subunit HcnC precursor [Botrimarina hoheduenensis]